MKTLILVLTISLLSACASTRTEIKEAWEGRQISDAIAEFGPPSYTTNLPDGVVIYTWEDNRKILKGLSCKTGLHVNQEGIIVDASKIAESLLCQ